MSVGEKLRYVRKIKRLTQPELAEKSDLATITIRQYESGKRSPSARNILQLSKALGIRADYFFYDNIDIADFTGFLYDPETEEQQKHRLVLPEHLKQNSRYIFLSEKAKKNELSPEEIEELDNIFENAASNLKSQRYGKYYELLNAAGKNQADRVLDNAEEQIALLTEIKKYRKEQE